MGDNKLNILLKKETNYVFTFGYTGVGKSSIIASIVKVLSHNFVYHINPQNEYGNQLQFLWLNQLKKGEFPPRSRIGEITEIDLAIELKKKNVRLTFLEISGEDLSEVDIQHKKSDGEERLKPFRKYLLVSKLIMIVASAKDGGEDDLLLYQFLNYLISNGINVPIAFIISKWDNLSDEETLREYMKRFLPMSLNLIKSSHFKEVAFFKFSLGKVAENEHREVLQSLHLNDTMTLCNWILPKL